MARSCWTSSVGWLDRRWRAHDTDPAALEAPERRIDEHQAPPMALDRDAARSLSGPCALQASDGGTGGVGGGGGAGGGGGVDVADGAGSTLDCLLRGGDHADPDTRPEHPRCARAVAA